ncbi:MAG: hypothetical protein ABIN74_04175, partial [Ferruginibacter sp.]
MKRLLFSALFFATALSYFSCQKNQPDTVQPATPAQQSQQYVILPASDDQGPIRGRIDGCFPEEVTLVAGQTMNAGSITVTNDADNIYVTYATTNGWKLTETHLYVGDC